jgi:succinate dehydrogenase/fumarate reductase-like Fe-S protein
MPRHSAVAMLTILLALPVGACSADDVDQTLSRAVESTARSACEAAGNCRNTCPDGSNARGPGYRCP